MDKHEIEEGFYWLKNKSTKEITIGQHIHDLIGSTWWIVGYRDDVDIDQFEIGEKIDKKS